MRARNAVLLLLSLVLVGCPKDEKKSDSSSSDKAKKDDGDKKKKSDDDDDSTSGKKKKKKTGDDDDDSTADKPKKKKAGDDDDDDSTADKPKKKKAGDDDDDNPAPDKKKPAGDTLTLGCADSVNGLGPKAKSSFTATCPKGCLKGSVWGSGPYTADSPICVAAVHAGAIGSGGGDVDVSVGPGLGSYKGSTKNGVTTGSWGPFPKSFTVSSSGDGGGKKESVDDTSAPLFAGLYSSNWGTTTFTQKGDKVSGAYPGGTLNCTVVKEISLACSWFESDGSGHAFLTRNRTSGVISGSWGEGASTSDGGSWTFTPIGKPK